VRQRASQALATVAVFVPLAAIAVACGQRESIEVASIEDAGFDATSIECNPATPCPEEYFCASTSCGELGVGHCELIDDANCAEEPYDPVCDCDGVTYFSDCLRRAAKKSMSGTGVCQDLMTGISCEGGACGPTGGACLTNSDCKAGICAGRVLLADTELLYDALCELVQTANLPTVLATLASSGLFLGGTCWVLPPTCPPSTPLVRGCLGQGQCLNACAAIRQGGTYLQCSAASCSAASCSAASNTDE
jgi:Kazal-type serine protease inhibitor domain